MDDRGVIEVFGDGVVDPADGRFLFHVVPTLQQLASCEVALKIWYDFSGHLPINNWREVRNENQPLSNLSADDHLKEMKEFVKLQRIPQLVEQMIVCNLVAIRREVSLYVNYLIKFETSNGFEKYSIGFPDPKYLVWSQNSKIDYKKTASKMICNLEFTPIQKFIIMSIYCLEYELGSFSICDLPKEFIEEMNFEKNCLVFYWICRSKNELDKIPLENFHSVDAAMASYCSVKRWLAFEYFWNRLGADDQVTIAVITFSECWVDYRKLISRMSKLQQYQLFYQIPVDIILNFCIESQLWIAFRIWLITRNSMSEEQFDELMIGVLRFGLSSEVDMQFLIDVWNSASDLHKNYFARTITDHIVEIVEYQDEEFSANGFQFLVAVLSIKDEQSKKEMVRKISDSCHFRIPHSVMKFIRMCLSSEKEVMEFKKSVTNSSSMLNHCIDFLHHQKFDQCYELFDVYSPDNLATSELMQRILQSELLDAEKFVLEYRKWNIFSEFVDKAFSNDLLLLSSWKKQFLSTFATRCLPECVFGIDLNELTRVVEQVFVPDELATFKETLLDSFRLTFSTLTWVVKMNEKYFHDFIFWCGGDESKVNEFKTTIPIDNLFNTYFYVICNRECAPTLHQNQSIMVMLENLGICLAWCFKSVEEIKKYKMSKIYEPEQKWLPVFVELYDESLLTVLLKWIFDNDEEEICKFRLEKMLKMMSIE